MSQSTKIITGAASDIVELADFSNDTLYSHCSVCIDLFDSSGLPANPSGGTIVYEYQSFDSKWRKFDIAPKNYIEDGYNQIPQVNGPIIRKVRATFLGLPIGTTFKSVVFASGAVSNNIDSEIYGGNQAITVQPFTESNSKNGMQYEAAIYTPNLAKGASISVVIEVGAQPVIIKGIDMQYNSTRLSSQLFRGPTYTGGTEVTVYNLNDELSVPDDVVVLAGVTVTDDGTAIGIENVSIGSSQTGNREISSLAITSGIERILWRNSTYHLKVTNLDTSNATALSVAAAWYQGGLSIGQ